MSREIPGSKILSTILVAACAGGSVSVFSSSQERRDPTAAQEKNELPPNDPSLQVVPLPDLETVEPAVAAQLRSFAAYLKEVEEGPSSPAELSEAFGGMGRLYHAYDFLSSAIACYLNAHHLSPNDFRWTYYLASVHQSRGELDEAVLFYKRALALQSRDLATMVHLGEIYVEQGHLEEAERLFGDALDLSPGCAAARTGLGQVSMARRDYRSAIEQFEAALEIVPDANRLHYLLGMAYRGAGDDDQARWHLARRGGVGTRVADPLIDELRLLTRGEIVHLLRGRLAFRFGRYRVAAEEFRKAVDADPGSYRARVNFGSALAQLGELEAAVDQYTAAVSLFPEGATAHFNLGSLFARMKRYDPAVLHLKAAIDAEPDDSRAHFELAEAMRAKGDQETAGAHYRRAAELDPSNELAVLGEAATLMREGNYREARTRLEEAMEQYPQRAQTAHALARLLASCPDSSLRNGQRALEIARKVFEASATASRAETVAMAYAEMGHCDEADRWQQKAVTLAMRAGRGDWAEILEETLARYESGGPCAPPTSK